MSARAAGFGLGLLVAAQIGPVSVLRGSLRIGQLSSNLLRPIGPLTGPPVKAAVAGNLGTLKRLLEDARPAAEAGR